MGHYMKFNEYASRKDEGFFDPLKRMIGSLPPKNLPDGRPLPKTWSTYEYRMFKEKYDHLMNVAGIMDARRATEMAIKEVEVEIQMGEKMRNYKKAAESDPTHSQRYAHPDDPKAQRDAGSPPMLPPEVRRHRDRY